MIETRTTARTSLWTDGCGAREHQTNVMGEFKFSCPGCGQHIQCDDQLGGQQIQCPSCQANLVVPQSNPALPSVPSAPQPQPASQLRISNVQHEPQHSAPAVQPPSRSVPLQRPGRSVKPEKKGGAMKVVTISAVVVALGAGFYFGFGWLSKVQDKTNSKRAEIEKNSDGGQIGHIAELYDVLDKTDPNRYSRSPGGNIGTEMPPPGPARSPGAQSSVAELPLIPAVWTLDVNTAKIPEGRANGKISGTNFVPDTARVDIISGAHVLSLRQGPATSPDLQIVVFLRLKPGENPAGHTWTVSQDMKGAGVSQVAKLWKPNPKYAPVRKNFAAGYAMRLEFGQMSEGVIPGKIFIALPDTEQSVVAGVFRAETAITEMNNMMPASIPAQPPPPVAGRQTPESRQGVVY